ncbi:putative UPF0481 protein At3g02645 [Alnus glutinosa]|uniref:putative UPF0481 protein At3g02645 n=1 Tax=Alnus glutinosa TaxID=3517 RepID=UPI002D775371|nr:putative UPF0481 protein At3g02645 [Alnus glutinosa]
MEFVDRERKQIMSNIHLIDIIDIEDALVDSMGKDLQSLWPLSTKCVIYKVSERLRRVKESAYTPKVVSIGPLHHGGHQGLRAMEEHKLRYLKDFIDRTGESLKFFVDFVRKNEAKLRSCYAETIQFSVDEFVKMILVDAAFIVEVLLKSSDRKLLDENDRIFNELWLIKDIWTDMLLLENQLPFFILEDLFEKYNKEVLSEYPTLVQLIEYFFKFRMESPGIEDRWEEFSSGDFKIKHFVDLLRHVQLKPVKEHQMKLKKLTMPNVTELHEAGVRFQVSRSENLIDIKFDKKNGILEIPSFIFSAETELIIRNSLAFEQHHYSENYINDYVILMNQLFETPMDIELLVKEGIVENRFNNTREGSDFLYKLAGGAILDQYDFYFASLYEELNSFYIIPWHKYWKVTLHRWNAKLYKWNKKLHRWKEDLKEKYFTSPWAAISIFAAIFLFILTIIQTVCSVMQSGKAK